MTTPMPPRAAEGDSWLLDIPSLQATEVVRLEQSIGELLATQRDIVLFGSEATLALEAIAVSVGRPGLRVLNLVTGPYGVVFGSWLTNAGSDVSDLVAPVGRAIAVDDVAAALAGASYEVVSVVHAEAVTGIVNDLPAICELARKHGAVTVVDAVASVGAEPLDIDGWDIDLAVMGPQKSLAGPVGISVATVSDRAWRLIERREPPVRQSSLSLLDWKTGWIDSARDAIPGYLPILETRALQAALSRALDQGLDTVVARHAAAARATRVAAVGLGLRPWAEVAEEAAGVATVVAAPPGVRPRDLADAAAAVGPSCLEVAPGALRDAAIRITHTGQRATWPEVTAALTSLHGALARLDPGDGRTGLGETLDAAFREM